MITKDIHIDRLLGEAEGLILEDREGCILLQAPTGSGKTYTHIHHFYESKCSYLFLVPTIALLNDIKSKYDQRDGVYIGSGFEFLNAHKNAKTLITTYDSIQHLQPYRFKRVYIDEAHLIAGHAEFRSVCTDLLGWHENTTYTTATPETMDRLNIDHKLVVQFEKPKDTFIDIRLNKKDHSQLDQAIWLIESNLKEGKQTIININNKKTLEQLYEHFESRANMVVLKSFRHIGELTEGQNEAHVKKVVSGELPKDVDVLLTTSVLYAGVSLKTHRDVYAYMLSGSGMPHPVDVVQFAARVRDNDEGYKLYLTVQGAFGNFELQSNKVQYSNKEQTSKALESEYEVYQKLRETDYCEVLNRYNLYPDYKILKVPEVPVEALKSCTKDITIVKNLHTFPQYMQLKEKCQMLNLGTGIFEQGTAKHPKGTKYVMRVNRLVTTLEQAVHYAIPFDFFITEKRYEDKLVDCLVKIREIIKNEKDKEIIMKSCQWLDSDKFKIDWSEMENLSTTAAYETYKKFLGIISTFSRKIQKTKTHNAINRDMLAEYMSCLKDECNTLEMLFN